MMDKLTASLDVLPHSLIDYLYVNCGVSYTVSGLCIILILMTILFCLKDFFEYKRKIKNNSHDVKLHRKELLKKVFLNLVMMLISLLFAGLLFNYVTYY